MIPNVSDFIEVFYFVELTNPVVFFTTCWFHHNRLNDTMEPICTNLLIASLHIHNIWVSYCNYTSIHH